MTDVQHWNLNICICGHDWNNHTHLPTLNAFKGCWKLGCDCKYFLHSTTPATNQPKKGQSHREWVAKMQSGY